MPNFILTYHGGEKPESPEEGAKNMAEWKAWIENLGDAVVNPGTPLGMFKTVSSDGISDEPGANPMSGYTVVQADDMNTALDMAKTSPFLDMNTATIGVAEMILDSSVDR